MNVEWPPIPLYIAFAIVATWGSVLGAELRKEDINSVEERDLSLLRKLLQWSGVGAAVHLLIYLGIAYCKTLGAEHFLSSLSVVMHITIVAAVMVFMTFMFTVSFKRTRKDG